LLIVVFYAIKENLIPVALSKEKNANSNTISIYK